MEPRIGVGWINLGPSVIRLRLEECGEFSDREVAVAVGAIGIHIHECLDQERVPFGFRVLKIQDGLAVVNRVARE